jgi:hypothetical protein
MQDIPVVRDAVVLPPVASQQRQNQDLTTVRAHEAHKETRMELSPVDQVSVLAMDHESVSGWARWLLL